MKITSLLLIPALASLNFAAPLSQTSSSSPLGLRGTDSSSTSLACSDPGTAIPFLRGYSSSATDHFYTTNALEMENAVANLGYASEGDAALIFGTQDPTSVTIPLYRIYRSADTDHFYTTDANERANTIAGGGTDEGIAGYVYSSSVCPGLVPFYRAFSPSADDHFYTTNLAERNTAITSLGYVDEGVAAYVLLVPGKDLGPISLVNQGLQV
ncbi:hypothetical protein OF83DRAFT_1172313 [Amylostereum chailletii]|nr:hypothetical protein OF83DRAFT_1172313 [Amylostereum chailletii]